MQKKFSNVLMALAALFLTPSASIAQEKYDGPIIDMHMHAFGTGPTPRFVCAPADRWPAWFFEKSAEENFGEQISRACDEPLRSPETDAELRDRTIEQMKTHNIVLAMLGGRPGMLEYWHEAAPMRFIPSLDINLRDLTNTEEEIRELARTGRIRAIFEVLTQYQGIPANSRELDPIYSLGEELDLPVGVHFSQGPAGNAYTFGSTRVAHTNPFLLEEALLAYPKLRVWVVHGAYPMTDAMKAMLGAHPRLYLDVGVHSFILPEKAYHDWICDIVDSGFADRIMFGSDSQVWPQAIPIAIDRTMRAPCLDKDTRRGIFYDNAARFLGLSDETIARHHALSGTPD